VDTAPLDFLLTFKKFIILNPSMKVLITGAAGFVGNNIARFLIDRGHDVGLLIMAQNWRTEDLDKKASILIGDMSNIEELKKIIQDFRPEMICHFAAYGAYPRTQKDFRLMIQTNLINTLNLIESAEEIPIINVGSSSEYGLKDAPMKETDSCMPDNDYGLTKLYQTLLCQKKGIPTLRLFSIYGPFEDENRLIPKLIKSKIKDLPVSLLDSVRDYVYSEDVAEAFLMAAQKYKDIKGEIINIGSGQQTTTETVVSVIDSMGAKSLKISWNFNQVQSEPKNWLGDISKAKNLLGWQPKTDINQGLKKTYDWWKKWMEQNYQG